MMQENIEMEESNTQVRQNETLIGGTVYIVESMESNEASETAENKVKRLILNNLSQLKIPPH